MDIIFTQSAVVNWDSLTADSTVQRCKPDGLLLCACFGCQQHKRCWESLFDIDGLLTNTYDLNPWITEYEILTVHNFVQNRMCILTLLRVWELPDKNLYHFVGGNEQVTNLLPNLWNVFLCTDACCTNLKGGSKDALIECDLNNLYEIAKGLPLWRHFSPHYEHQLVFSQVSFNLCKTSLHDELFHWSLKIHTYLWTVNQTSIYNEANMMATSMSVKLSKRVMQKFPETTLQKIIFWEPLFMLRSFRLLRYL